MNRGVGLRGTRVALAATLLMVWGGGAMEARTARAPVGPGMVATLGEDGALALEALPLKSEGLLAFSRRLTGSNDAAGRIAELNGGARTLLVGVRYQVPFELLLPDLQRRLVQAIFTGDQAESGAWRHEVLGGEVAFRESLWRIAEWFTGSGRNFQSIRAANGLVEDHLVPGQALRIPRELLRPAFREVVPAGEVVQAPSRATGGDGGAQEAVRRLGMEPGSLAYGRDRDGEFAVYRLRPGEALYSSVVVRFTGRLTAVDVNALAGEIARRSGIRDVTDIPVGYPVKVPFDLLLPEYLPSGHPRRQAYEKSLAESAAFSNQVRATDLSGITVIVDPGHGGKAVGASINGVWESLYVYDVALRVERLLRTTTAARVHLTTRDDSLSDIPERDVLRYSRSHRVMTEPPYLIEDPKVGVNLRWYLANSLYRRALGGSAKPEQVVFISIHADSLHPSLRGMTAYIPAASLRAGTYGKSGALYASRREVREAPQVSYSWRERVQSEGLSRQLAQQMVRAFEDRELPIHPFKPVREKIIRNRREWVPAVLRYNGVPAKLLLEIINLANPEDRRLIQTRAYRQRIAEAIAEGILGYYGHGDGVPRSRPVAAAR